MKIMGDIYQLETKLIELEQLLEQLEESENFTFA